MDTLFNIVTLFGVALLGLVLVLVALRLLDRLLFPDLSFESALGSNNVAVGIFLAAVVFGIFFLVSRATAAELDRYDEHFRKWGRYEFGYSYDWRHFKGQGMTESNLDPTVCSQVGACGVMQFMPGTAVAMGLQDRFDAKESIRRGIGYDRQLWRQWQAERPPLDRLQFAFASYNAGLGNVLKFQRAAIVADVENPNLWEQVAPFAWREPREYIERIERWRGRFARGP
jgi:membrane-bound lytic murein transglycosylase F